MRTVGIVAYPYSLPHSSIYGLVNSCSGSKGKNRNWHRIRWPWCVLGKYKLVKYYWDCCHATVCRILWTYFGPSTRSLRSWQTFGVKFANSNVKLPAVVSPRWSGVYTLTWRFVVRDLIECVTRSICDLQLLSNYIKMALKSLNYHHRSWWRWCNYQQGNDLRLFFQNAADRHSLMFVWPKGIDLRTHK